MHRNDFASIWSGPTVRSALRPWPAERKNATAHDIAVHAVLRIERLVTASMTSMRISPSDPPKGPHTRFSSNVVERARADARPERGSAVRCLGGESVVD